MSSLAVTDAGSAFAENLLREMEPAGEVDRHVVLERDGCERWFPGLCHRIFAVPDEEAVLAMTIAEEGDGSYDGLEVAVERVTLPDPGETQGYIADLPGRAAGGGAGTGEPGRSRRDGDVSVVGR